jgi:hypothetical protein
MFSVVSKLTSAIRSLANSRYPNLLINQSCKQSLSEDEARLVAMTAGIRFIDFRDEILPTDTTITLGAFTRSEFQDWLNAAAKENSGILLWNSDVLISTWDERGRKGFFKEFLLNGVNYGPSTVLVSWLGSNFDLEEIHNGEIKIVNIDKIDLMGD